MAAKPQKIFKVVVIGSAGVGKTSIIRRFCENSFLEGYKTTIGSDFYVKKLDLEQALVNLSVWDLAGDPKFRTLLTGNFDFISFFFCLHKKVANEAKSIKKH